MLVRVQCCESGSGGLSPGLSPSGQIYVGEVHATSDHICGYEHIKPRQVMGLVDALKTD